MHRVADPAAVALTHSWPLFERERRFDLGQDFDWDGAAIVGDAALLADHGVGVWSFDLAGTALSWSAAVYDLFGLPRGAALTRDETVALYAEPSRAVMERLRAHALRHRRGFTLDAELRPADGGTRWMRLIAAPVVEHGRVVRLCGVKRAIVAAR